MVPDPEQIPSRTCDCPDCIIDLPPARYGERPPQDGCHGPRRARFRVDGKRRTKNFRMRGDAARFLATLQPKARGHAA